MTHFNFLSNLAAENEVNRALATAKVLQNAGGGTSHTSEQFSRYCVSRSEGAHKAEHFSQKTYSLFAVAADGGQTCDGNRQSRLMSYRCYLRNLAMIFAVLVMSMANIGTAWGDDYTIIALSSFTESPTGTYTKEGLSELKCKNYTNILVEVPSASASGTVSWVGSGSNNDRFLYIYKTNGTVKDETRKIVYARSYGSVDFTSSDIKTNGGKYYLVFGTTDDWKADGVKYTLAASSCEAPSSVSVAPTNANGWRYSLGETIDLTCTATGGTGTKTYQWQKYIGSTWTDINTATNASAGTARLQIANCTSSDGGSYRCVVSTGATCSLESDGYYIRVFTLNGAYYGGSDTENAIVWTDANTGVATVHLNASSTYMFKVTDNDGRWFGYGENNYIIQPVALDCGTENQKLRLLTGPEGDYTFTINVQHAADVSPYVNIATGYPTVSHPNSGYAYITKWWDCYVHYWEGTNNALTAWGSDPKINSDRYVNICGTDYWYFPVIDTYNKFIAKNKAGDATDSNTTGNQETTGHGGQYITHSGSWGWHEFSTYSITYTGNGGGGSMSATSGICPDADQAITSNAFTAPAGCASFAHWTANVAVKVGGETVVADNPIANGATIQDINSDITLTAVWKLAAPTIADNGDNTFSISGSMAGSSYYYTTNNSTPTTSSSLYSAAVDFSAGEVNITAKAIAHKDGYVDSDVASQACTYHAPAEGCIDANLTNFGAGNSSGDASKTLADGTVVAMNKCTNSASSVSIGGNILFTAPTGKAFETFSFVATCGSIDKTNYYKINGGSQQSLESSTTTAKTYTITIPGATNATTIQIIKNGTTPAVSSFCYTLKDICTTPTTAFANGAYTVGGSALDLSTLISSEQGSGAITYTVKNANGTGASIDGTNFTATSAGTATVTATQAANGEYCEKVMDATITVSAGGGCTPQSVVKTVLSSTTAGTTTGYNNDEYAGSATIVTFQGTPIDGGYEMQSGSKLFVTLKKGNFVEGDKINIVITKASDLTNTTGKLPIFYNASSPALLTTIDASSAGTYTYTLTASDITTLGSNKTIGVFRSSSTTENNPYVKSVEVEGCRDWTVDETAPTFVSSVPANGATDVATSGTIVLTFNEPLGSVDPSKFTLTGATKGTVTIDGSDAAKVNITYTGAENSSTVTLATDAAAVSDLAGNALAAALSDISFTTAAAAPAGDCITIAYFETTSHSNSSSKPDNAGKYIYGYTNSAKTEAYAYTITSSTGDNKGQGTGESDYLRMNYGTTVTIYADNTTTGGTPASFSNVTSVSVDFKMKNSSYYTTFDIYVGGTKIANNVSLEGAAQSAFTTFTYDNLEQLSGTVRIVNKGSGSSNYHFYVDNIQICTSSLPACTTPELPKLSNKTVCEGGDADVAWDATVDNASDISTAGETVTYSWKKKGNDTELANTATFDLGSSATEAMAGTYVVTVTVSKAGYASSMATKEVTLTVNEATEVTAITADKATVYPTNSVTLTATANVTPQSWQWYTCTSAEGAGEAIINDATSANYTIASAGSAGTYYYKVTATGSCGTAERVYTLTVTAASECENYFWFVYADDAPHNGVVNNRDGFFTGAPTGSSNSGTYKFTLDGTEYEARKNTGSGSFSMSFTIPEGSTATMGINCKGSSSKPLYLTHASGTPQKLVSNSSSNGSFAVEDITEGTWTLTSAGSWTLAALGVQVCKTSTCTDATPTIAAANTTVCVGGELSITATGYESDPTSIQWQKLNSSTSTWDNISDASSATYTVAQATAADAGSYRVVVTKECARTSNTVTISVPSAPNFGSTVPASVSVMATQALSITDVEASDATSYAWYKSADATYDAGTDTKVGTAQELLLASGGEAAGDTYYLFCVASNACGTTTSTAITVNVTAFIEEDCATKGNEGAADFGFVNTKCPEETYSETACWKSGGRAYYLTYSAPTGKYLEVAKVTVASSKDSKCGYAYSTDNGTNWTYAELTGLSTTLTEKTIDLSGKKVTDFRIGRNLQDGSSKDWGSTSGTFYLSKICFEYSNACTATTVTPSKSSVNYTMGGDWTNPTFTLSVAGTLTYSSSNEDIASVDESGKVTFNDKAGTVTITASYAGNATYCASEGSYTINVSCPGGAPKIVADGSVNMSGCNSSVTLNAKQQDGTTDFTGGSYQWFRNGVEIEGATSNSYTATQTGVYTVAYTSADDCTSPSTNNATVTSDNVEPEVERLVPFQYYHVDKTYSAQMKDRHLFSVKGSAAYGSTGKNFKLTMSRNSEAATDITTAASIFVTKSGDGQVDTVMIDLNKLSGKYSEGDELVLTCAAVDCSGNVSAVYKDEITIHVIGAKPTLALICSGSSKAGGTRKTDELTVGGDFLTGYNKADLCQQTDNQTFDANTEWGLYTDLKANYIVTPVNGYAVFNKLNYEPFDILLLTDYPKASKSDAAATVLDDMADLCDYRPMLSFKTHMVAKSPSKWAAKGFTTSPVVPKNTRTRLNIVCYAHPMFADMQETATHIQKDNDDLSQIVYTMLTGAGYEGSKGLQGFELEAAENFVTIGLVHYNATPADGTPSEGLVTWTPGSEDRMLVTAIERQENIEARMIVFAVNCGAQSKLTETGRNVVLKCLEYLLDDDPLHVADCSFTFDNGAGNSRDAAQQAEDCPSCTGTKGDGKWSTAANWGPVYVVRPGKDTEVKIAAHVIVDKAEGEGAATNFTPKVRNVRIVEGGQVEIPAGSYLEVVSTIRRQDGNDLSPTEANDIVIGSSAEGNGTLIFNNNAGDTKARVALYSTAQADVANMSAATSTWQYIGTPHNDVANARSNYYGSWLYQYNTDSQGWEVIPNGGPLQTFRGYCVTHPSAPVVFDMSGTLAATTSADIDVPANKYVVTANSWVAPIDISKITDDDMEGISDKAIYFFNTGSDSERTGTVTENATDDARWAVGTYVTIPIHSAPYTGTDDHIPSMQGFYVWSTTAGTLHLDYDRHVRGTSRTNKISGRMHAPKRVQAEDNAPEVLWLVARGNHYDDRLVVLEREDFTRNYESGWDGEAWGGSDLSPMVYITNEAGVDEAVSAIPEFEGTQITFRAGEDSEYRFEFTYSEEAEPLYLLDTDNNTYTQVVTGNEYYFTTYDKSPHKRFVLTRKAPQIATGIEPTSDSSLKERAKKLLIEDKLYILLNGMLYDATGKVVK